MVIKFHVSASAMAIAIGIIISEPAWANGITERVSVATGGRQANGYSFGAALTPDGRFVAFASDASNLVPGDTNGRTDVFVHDRQTGTTQRVNLGPGGVQPDGGNSGPPAISGDGRLIAFQSDASNLVRGDTNGKVDLFVHDRQTGTTQRVSVAAGGGQGNDHSYDPAISANGRFVAFASDASNLVPGDTNGRTDVFAHDRQTGTIRRVSVTTGGTQGNANSYSPALSSDGRFVAFASYASNLAPGDINRRLDVFVHDRKTGTTRRVSLATGGGQSNGDSDSAAISADGRFIAFHSSASNLVPSDTNRADDVFVHDRQMGTTRRMSVSTSGSQGDNHSFDVAVSANGRWVVFYSGARNLVSNDTNDLIDVFVHDCQAGMTRRVSIATGGSQGNDASYNAVISADGRFVAFASGASNLVPGDTNDISDVFVRSLRPDVPPP